MRDMFRGYYQPTDEEIAAIWQDGLVALDANVLLSLYNVLPTTSSLYLGAMEKRRSQMWIPYQVALEFHQNVHKERARQTTAHQNRIKQLDGLLGELRSTARKSRFQASDVQDRAVEGLTALKEELVAQKGAIAEQTNHRTPDALLERISVLFEGQVGPEPDQTTLDRLYKEGEKRFSSEIPPGYEDAKTKTGNRKYGDYVLWRQLMDQATREKTDLIFVTDDDKADWWLKIEKTSIAPRPELIQEFRAETGQDILILNSSQFYHELVPATGDAAHSEEVIAAQEDMEAAVSESKEELSVFNNVLQALQQFAKTTSAIKSPSETSGHESALVSRIRTEQANTAAEIEFLTHQLHELEYMHHSRGAGGAEGEVLLRELDEVGSRLDEARTRRHLLEGQLISLKRREAEGKMYGE